MAQFAGTIPRLIASPAAPAMSADALELEPALLSARSEPDEAGGMLVLGQPDDEEAPAVRCVNRVLSHAIGEEASDVHVEPQRAGLLVRYRIDGVMFDRFALPRELAAPMLSRIKILSRIDIAERRLPQDGRFGLRSGADEFDVRVCTAPGVLGEKAVLRLLPKNSRQLALADLGLDTGTRAELAALVQRPHGMLLVTGPTGSGKTTTLYAALREINSVCRNTITIEDPAEYELARVTQIQVHPKIGLTFAAGLRSILRQDPDVVMIGEIRDAETLAIAIQAALTGHLVLTTLHCNDAAGAAARCIDMGAEPFLFTSATTAIAAQRLIRRVCDGCRERRPLSADLLRSLGAEPEGSAFHYAGRGCPACRNTGYRGRTAVFELLRLTEAVRTAIHNRESSAAIRRIAVAGGMRTLRMAAVEKMLAGVTTPEEVLRAVYLEE